MNGRGMFLSASNPEELVQSLLDIMQNISARQGSASSLSVNGDELWEKVGPFTRLFQASYASGNMTGDVKSYLLNPTTGVLIPGADWEAAALLDSKVETLGHGSRIIATYNPETGAGFPFRYADMLTSGTTTQRDALEPDWSTSIVANAENMINYLRGDDTYELRNGGPFRSRDSRLGDIINSSPLYVDGVLYVGGNDGLMHAFSSLSGEELFCYVSSLVYGDIKELGNPGYKHKFFVDQTPRAGKNMILSGTTVTMLVGGLGKGGKGYYAIDISPNTTMDVPYYDMESGTTSMVPMATFLPPSEAYLGGRVMWEYPNSGTTTSEVNDMGYSFSTPFIGRSNDPTYPWIIGFGNGYNSNNAHAVLIILDPETGTLLKKIDTMAGGCNGLSSPIAIDDNYDGKIDAVLAGDLKGNMWKFDLRSSDHELWDVAFYESGTTPMPLFKAAGPGGSTQPITTKPEVMNHCDKKGNMVLFTTGKFLNEADVSNEDVQSVYGIWDYCDNDDDTEYLGTFQRGATPQLSNQPSYDVSLVEQTVIFEGQYDFNGDGLDADDPYIRVLSANEPDWDNTEVYEISGVTYCGDPGTEDPLGDCDPNSIGTLPDPIRNAGWYRDFSGASGNASSEKGLDDVLLRLGKLIFITYTPEDALCSSGGFSWLEEVDACNGGRLTRPQFDLNGDGILDENDLIPITIDGETVLVPPTSWRFEGRLQPPVIQLLPGEMEVKSLSRTFNNQADIQQVWERGPRIGVVHWIEREQ
jgi:Tfp pilus tip-associated adhesin PilY1